MKKASIVIPTRNKLSRLLLVLKALETQLNDSVEVLVVFDGCTLSTIQGFEEAKLQYRPVPIILPYNMGRAKARNAGIRKATGEIVIFLDDDRIPAPDFVARHIKKHAGGRFAVIGERLNVDFPENHLAAFLKGGLTAADYQQIKEFAFAEPLDFLKKTGRRILGQRLETVTFTTGNSSVRREDLIRVGLFDEQFSGWGMEDVDLGYRLARDGVKIIRDYGIINYHLVHQVDRSRQREEYYRNFNYFLSKIHHDKTAIFMAKLLNVIM